MILNQFTLNNRLGKIEPMQQAKGGTMHPPLKRMETVPTKFENLDSMMNAPDVEMKKNSYVL
jgi:hypothetical protein